METFTTDSLKKAKKDFLEPFIIFNILNLQFEDKLMDKNHNLYSLLRE